MKIVSNFRSKFVNNFKTGKGNLAPVVIWDLESGRVDHVFDGITGEVFVLSFSPDSRFLAATGDNRYFFIWDMTTHEIVYQRRTEGQGSLLVWADNYSIPKGSRYPAYVLCTAFDGLVQKHDLVFNISTMAYEMLKKNLKNISGT